MSLVTELAVGQIRRLRCGDEPEVRRFFAELTRATLFRRLHAPIRSVPEVFFARVFAPVHPVTQALVAVVDGSTVGPSQLVPSSSAACSRAGGAEPAASSREVADAPAGSADLAVVVADGYRRRELGRHLVGAFATQELPGWRLRAEAQPDNVAALGLARMVAPDAHHRFDGDSVVFGLEIARSAAPAPAPAPGPGRDGASSVPDHAVGCRVGTGSRTRPG